MEGRAGKGPGVSSRPAHFPGSRRAAQTAHPDRRRHLPCFTPVTVTGAGGVCGNKRSHPSKRPLGRSSPNTRPRTGCAGGTRLLGQEPVLLRACGQNRFAGHFVPRQTHRRAAFCKLLTGAGASGDRALPLGKKRSGIEAGTAACPKTPATPPDVTARKRSPLP